MTRSETSVRAVTAESAPLAPLRGAKVQQLSHMWTACGKHGQTLWRKLWTRRWTKTLVPSSEGADDAPVRIEEDGVANDKIAQVAIDFIAFCFERRGADWPVLYDEMCYVASKRLYRGLGYEELKEAGLDFTLAGLARTSRLTNEVTRRMRQGALAAT
jgi:hypothetical protein